jgi:hypothetical protein
MAAITGQDRAAFRERGYVVIPGVLDDGVTAGRSLMGGHDGPVVAAPRLTAYYRLRTVGHEQRWREAVTYPLLEFA